MKKSKLERQKIERISTISGVPKKDVESVLIALLKTFAMKTYASVENSKSLDNDLYKELEDDLIIPFVARLKIKFKNKKVEGKGMAVDMIIKGEPFSALYKELSCILEGESTLTEQYISNNIFNKIKSFLGKEDSSE